MIALLLLLTQADTVNRSWTLGSRVHANATVYARVGPGAADSILGTHVAADKGTLVGGPVGPVADGTVRWNVRYDTPPSGWSTQRWLTLDSLAGTAPVPASIAVNALRFTLYLLPTAPFRLRATVRDAAGTILTVPVTWSVSNPAVTTIDDTGLVTPRGIGIDTIAAAANNLRAFSVATVIPAPALPTIVCRRTPPPPGCGMDPSWWTSLGVGRTAGTYGPWFILDSLGYKRQTVRVIVTDTTP